MPTIPADIIAAAKASQAKWKIPASISIAQWAVESGYGRHMPAGSNNPFGIKARAGEPSVGARTREVLGGKDVYITDGFRKFDSIADAFDKHGEFLATRRPYANARTKLPDPDAFADALTGVYATDPHYGSVLKGLMRSANLYQYNDGAAPPAPAHPTLRLGDKGRRRQRVVMNALGFDFIGVLVVRDVERACQSEAVHVNLHLGKMHRLGLLDALATPVLE